MSKRFTFGPQPALDKAINEQKRAEQAVAEARAELESEQQRLRQMEQQIEQTTQQIRAAHDKLADPSRKTSDARELQRQIQFLDALQARKAHQIALMQQQRERVTWAAEKLELRKRELAEAMAAVQALERLKEKRRAEHEQALLKKEETQRDDDAIQRWNAKNR